MAAAVWSSENPPGSPPPQHALLFLDDLAHQLSGTLPDLPGVAWNQDGCWDSRLRASQGKPQSKEWNQHSPTPTRQHIKQSIFGGLFQITSYLFSLSYTRSWFCIIWSYLGFSTWRSRWCLPSPVIISDPISWNHHNFLPNCPNPGGAVGRMLAWMNWWTNLYPHTNPKLLIFV